MRDRRLVECVQIIRRLLRGEEVTHEGLVHVNRARLWTLPETVPDLVGPAVTPETAARHAAWADGLITVNRAFATWAKTNIKGNVQTRETPGMHTWMVWRRNLTAFASLIFQGTT